MARFDLKYYDVRIFSARHIAYMLSALYAAVARPSVHQTGVS